jgi:hypothetical protein
MTRARIIPPLLIALIFFVAGCAATPASDRPEPFTLPVLTMAELHRLMDETIAAQGDETAQPLAIAHILCGAKGYHRGGAKFIACRERLANAAIAKPGVLAKARALARIAEKLAAIRQPKRRQPDGAVTGLGRPTPCYDLSRARLVICVDI